MELNHRQTQNKIPHPKETTTTNTKTQLKLHKPNIPIRSVINNMNTPTCKIVKHLVRILNKHFTLKNYYNVSDSTKLATD